MHILFTISAVPNLRYAFLRGYIKGLSIKVDIQYLHKNMHIMLIYSYVDIVILIELCFLGNYSYICICYYILKIVM